MRTCSNYIHEYDAYDNLMDCILESEDSLNSCISNFENKKRELEYNVFFSLESVDDCDALMEAENDNIFAKIGTIVTNILKQIADFLRDIGKAITGNTERARTDMEIVTDMMKDHPELVNKISDGIDKEWFTYKDVAKFETDIAGLVSMLKKNELDHKTFIQKVGDKTAEFTSKSYPIIKGAFTVGSIAGIPALLARKCAESSKALASMKSLIEDARDIYRNNREVHNAGPAASVINALGKVVGVISKECSDRTATQSKFCQILSKITKGKIDIKRSKASQAKFIAKSVTRKTRRMAREANKETEVHHADDDDDE